jgi:hypothetical protein
MYMQTAGGGDASRVVCIPYSAEPLCHSYVTDSEPIQLFDNPKDGILGHQLNKRL